ncbi:EAL domain-containing protein [Marinilactibacillus piezotolerans]|uniref:EAL domain-containing protein n=1 Tax=Marinilactibacillus piezotolerans TaxID=258723 RepID=UPI0009B0B3B7|nr:EAL domain-containing protein [Marinilactibacillus piezotolerans]
MVCINCSTFGQRIAFQLNELLLPLISKHFTRYGHEFEVEGLTLITNESGANDVYNFLNGIELTDGIQFRINQQEWHTIDHFSEYIDAAWIDSIINEQHLKMHFQPIVKTDGTIYGYELLARFHDDDGNTLYPNTIFPAAKARGRTFALDRVCRIHAVKQVDRLQADQKVFINFIPTAIYSPEHCLRTTTLIAKRLNIDPRRIVFEVVETEQIADLDHLKTILHYYQNHGFEYALDDVGAGFNTLEVLKEMKPPYMKLDMEYAQNVSEDPEKQAVAAAFLETARTFQAIPLAEGIERIEDFNWLKSLGYELFQGYLFGKPEPEPLASNQLQLI